LAQDISDYLFHLSNEEVRELASIARHVALVIPAVTLFEIGFRFQEQAGAPWRIRSWRYCLLPLFHKLEALALVCMFAAIVLFVLQCEIRYIRRRDRVAARAIVFYRCLRLWGIYFGVSPRASEKKRRHWKLPTTLWPHEEHERKRLNRVRTSVRLQSMFDSWLFQFGILAQLLVFVVLLGQEETSQDKLVYLACKFLGYFLLFLLILEFVVRATAQGGERFFVTKNHKIETFVLSLAAFRLGYVTFYYESIMDRRVSSLSMWPTLVLFTVHRAIRCAGL
jgi:hypothetical protein